MRSTHDRMKELGLMPDFIKCFTLDEWEMPRDKVVLNRKLGEGAFGTVFGGEAYQDNELWVAVAVKTLKPNSRLEEKVCLILYLHIMCSESKALHIYVWKFFLKANYKLMPN